MKFSLLLDKNIVPEWRDQYIDYRYLNATLERAIADKRLKTDNQYECLIKYDHEFAEHFIGKCRRELDKIDAFHSRKLNQVVGKYQNLKAQLEQVLASPMYREIQREREGDKSKMRVLTRATSQIKDNWTSRLKTARPVLSISAFVSKNQSTGPAEMDVNLARAQQCDDRLPAAGLTSATARYSAMFSKGGQSCSKSFLVESYKRKLSQLRFAYEELYYSLALLEQYTQLNHAAFEQILRKYDRMFASSAGRKFFKERIQVSLFYSSLHQIDYLIEGVEHLFTLHFVGGDRRKALEKLHISTNVSQDLHVDFRIGFELGVFIVLFALVLVAGFSSETSYEWTTVFRLFRSPMLLIIFLFQTGISLVIWRHCKINHVLIFELNPRDNLTYHNFVEFGSILGIIWSVAALVFIFSEELNVRPSICPLLIVLLIGCYLLNPTKTGHYRARIWLLGKLARIFTAPLQPVRFADFWIADQLVSIVPLFLDLEFLSCFYTTDDVFAVAHLEKIHSTRCVTRSSQDLIIRTFVAAFPAWTRCAQCLRRWRDENWRAHHLCNAFKYLCMVAVVFLSSMAQHSRTTFEFDVKTIVWLVMANFTSTLTAFWDIYYDFGLFNSFDTNKNSDAQTSVKKWPFLRAQLVYPVWVYYFAIVEDFLLRFSWILTISLTEFSGLEAGLAISLLAPLEMFRRFVWNCIRLENEQLNNCGAFREVRDIPIEVFAPIDESHVKKVIAMMDSKDGAALRKPRMLNRRTLRCDTAASFDLFSDDDNLYDFSRLTSSKLT